MESIANMRLGAWYLGNERCEFFVWAPFSKEVKLNMVFPQKRIIHMEPWEDGYWYLLADDIYPGMQYLYKLDKLVDRPDLASHFQPEGVHGPSEVVDHRSFIWTDNNWQGLPLNEMIIYELHVGTFSPEGTFDGIIQRLNYFKELGINAIEIMPVAQFPGERNWGYDGT